MTTNGDLDHALVERLNKHFPKPYEALTELRASGRGEELLAEWKGSVELREWRKGRSFDDGVLILSAVMGVSQEEAEKRAREYVAGGR